MKTTDIGALAAGDADAWEALRRDYAGLCWRWADLADVATDQDDIWQEAAIRLWRALAAGRFAGRGGAEFGRYLAMTVRSVALDRVRQAHVRATAAERAAADAGARARAGGAGDPPAAGEATDFWKLAARALGDDAPLVLGRIIDGAPSGPAHYDRQRLAMLRLRRVAGALYESYHGRPCPRVWRGHRFAEVSHAAD